MNNIYFLLSKDCMALESLPVYGNKYWTGKTPNIDELAANGTIYKKHYTAGGSTTMSMTAMLSGHYCYEFSSRKEYTNVKKSEFSSIFDYLQANGYSCHIIWDKKWTNYVWGKVGEFGDESKTNLHNLDIDAVTGSAKAYEDLVIQRDDQLLQDSLNQIFQAVDSINYNEKVFVWVHLPHVIKGRRCYMDDMDAFDEVVGYVRNKVGDDNIYLTTDHGHMNMHKGLVGYGFDVYEPIMHIPLITPRRENCPEVDYLTSHVDFIKLFTTDKLLPKRDYTICETQYLWQPKRKVAVLDGRFKYIYNKIDKSEELYDLEYDSDERYNILKKTYYDVDRKKKLYYDEYYLYPYIKEADDAYYRLKSVKDSFWIEPSKLSIFYQKMIIKIPFLKYIREPIKKIIRYKSYTIE